MTGFSPLGPKSPESEKPVPAVPPAVNSDAPIELGPTASSSLSTSSTVQGGQPAAGIVMATKAAHIGLVEQKALQLQEIWNEFIADQFTGHPELKKWNKPEPNGHRSMDPNVVGEFRTAVDNLFEQKLKHLGFKEYLGMGGTGAVFRVSIGDQDYSMKAFITKEDDKGYGHKINMPWTECKEINDMNTMVAGLQERLPVDKRNGRFDFFQPIAELYPRQGDNQNILVYPYMEGSPIIQGDIHHTPCTKWPVNTSALEKGVSSQWISDFLHMLTEFQLKERDISDMGRMHQIIYQDGDPHGKVKLLDPFGTYFDPVNSNTPNPVAAEKWLANRKEHPLVAPLFCLAGSISFLEWAQGQNKSGMAATENAWRSAAVNTLRSEAKLDAIYKRNLATLVEGIKLSIEQAQELGHGDQFTEEKVQGAIQLVIEGSKKGDDVSKVSGDRFMLGPLTDKGREMLERLSEALN